MVNYANKGKMLERFIEASNKQYELKGLALIQKIPTPMAKNSKKGQYFYSAKSTVDFVGVSHGQYIAFDAKETKVDRFPFSRLESHQKDYLNNTRRHGGYAFIIIMFTEHNKMYRLDIDEYNDLEKTLDRKSIPLSWFEAFKKPITSKNGVAFDYLERA